MKAVAINAVFIIFAILIFLFFISAIFFQWIDTTKLGASEATCRMKLLNYCTGIIKTGKPPFDWDKKEPTGCENYGIEKPTDEKCKQIVG